MDFDFNLILVPVTLLLGIIWVYDKLRKRKAASKLDSKAIQAAQASLSDAKHALESAWQQTYPTVSMPLDWDGWTPATDTASSVYQAYQQYRDAKRAANIATSGAVAAPQLDPFWIRWAQDFFPVLAVVLVVRSFLLEPFNIPSSSMVPTLYTGDFIAVNKFAYGVRLPLLYTKVLDTGSPQHGDVAVFRYPENPKLHYIKRIIGLPGDTVSFANGVLSVNGQRVTEQKTSYIMDPTLIDQLVSPIKDAQTKQWILSPEQAVLVSQREEQAASYVAEQLGEHQYLRRYLSPQMQYGDYSPLLGMPVTHTANWQVTVPANSYFVMGDNSDRSQDSRYWGFVPDSHLSGKAFYVWMHKPPGLNLPSFTRNGQIN